MHSKSGVRHARSFNDLDERKLYDVKVGYTKRKMPPIIPQPSQTKNKMVTFFRNGDKFFGGTKIAIQSEKYFRTLGNLQDYLTQRLKIPQGVRYIFTLDGRSIKDVNQLEDGGSYVVSGTKTFQEMDYGGLARMRTAVVRTNAGPLRPDDLILYREVDPNTETNKSNMARRYPDRSSSFRNSGVASLPGSRESCVVTVVNNYDHSIKSRVLLNLRTNQSFEDVMEDMGQSVKIKRATRMLTPWNQEVKGFSHLRNDLFEVETFYLDGGDVSLSTEHTEPKRLVAKAGNSRRFKHHRANSAPKFDGLVGAGPIVLVPPKKSPTLRMRIPDHANFSPVHSYFQR